jgi:hypothetical protein
VIKSVVIAPHRGCLSELSADDSLSPLKADITIGAPDLSFLGQARSGVLRGTAAVSGRIKISVLRRRYGRIAGEFVHGSEARGDAWANVVARAVVMRRCSIGRNAQSHQHPRTKTERIAFAPVPLVLM